MSTDVTMQELELETAELLPARETLCCSSHSQLQQLQHNGNVRRQQQVAERQPHASNVHISAANGNGDSNTLF